MPTQTLWKRILTVFDCRGVKFRGARGRGLVDYKTEGITHRGCQASQHIQSPEKAIIPQFPDLSVQKTILGRSIPRLALVFISVNPSLHSMGQPRAQGARG